MRRFITTGIQITLLAPAILCVPFILIVVLVIIYDLARHIIGLAEAVFAMFVAVGSLAGIVASMIAILSGGNFVRVSTSLKSKVRAGLVFGILGECSALICLAMYIVSLQKETSYQHELSILSWVLFFGPAIGVAAYQFLVLGSEIGRTKGNRIPV